MTTKPNPTAEQIERALAEYEAHAGCRGDEFGEYVCPECGHLYATFEDRKAKFEGVDLYEAGHRHRMTKALIAAGVAPREPNQNETKSGNNFVSLDPEKVAEVIAYANTALDDLPSPGSTAEALARALCEAYTEGKLTK